MVDDNQDLLQITKLILSTQGFEVFSATGLDEARQLLLTHPPDLLLLDVNICDEDGAGFCTELKGNAHTASLPVVLMSGDDLKKDCCKEADAFLVKPFDIMELVRQVKVLLPQRKAVA